MKLATPNPFLPPALSPEVPLPGRDELLDWLLQGLQHGARLLLVGPHGIGKSTLLSRAEKLLEQRNLGPLIHVDLSRHPSLESVVARILTAAGDLASASRANEDVLRPRSTRSTASDARLSLPAALERLAQAAGREGRHVTIAFDPLSQLRRLGGALIEQGLRESMQAYPSLGFVLTGTEYALSSILRDSAHPLHGLLAARSVEPIQPRALANWIDALFTGATDAAAGVGSACVECGGPRTSDILDLARRTYDLAIKAGFANAATVEKALAQAVDEKSAAYQRIWDDLSADERHVLRAVARGTIGEPRNSDPGQAFPDGVKPPKKSALGSLMERGLVEKLGSAGFRLESPALKGWTLQANLRVTRERATPTSTPTTRFAFDLSTQRSGPSKAVSPAI